MTGKELILYILQNDLEDKTVIENGVFVGFMTVEEAAVKFKVGVSTIRAWYSLGKLKGFGAGDSIFFFKNTPDPRKDLKCKK